MVREKSYKLQKLPYFFEVETIRQEYASVLTQRNLKQHHQHRTEKLAPGVEEYHTGGWHELILTEWHENNCRLIAEIEDMPITKAAIEWFKAPLMRVKFSVLKAGHKINPHVGNQEENEYCRFHIPIITNELCTFHVMESSYQPKAGELWYLNATKLHWVENNSDQDRVHLIIDVFPNDWVDQLMKVRPSLL